MEIIREVCHKSRPLVQCLIVYKIEGMMICKKESVLHIAWKKLLIQEILMFCRENFPVLFISFFVFCKIASDIKKIPVFRYKNDPCIPT